MKKKIVAISLALGMIASTSVYGKVDKELLFRDIPWRTSLTDVEGKYLVLDFFNLAGETFTTCSCDEIIYGQGNGIDFKNNDINISSSAYIDESENFSVAGYTPTEINMYYSYPVIDGHVVKEESESLLYGAEYEFEPQDLYAMQEDMKNKLTAIYGECDNEKQERNDWTDYLTTYTFWEGSNSTEIVLKAVEDTSSPDSSLHLPDRLYVIYLWRMGDDLLRKANDAIANDLKNAESANYGADNTDGL